MGETLIRRVGRRRCSTVLGPGALKGLVISAAVTLSLAVLVPPAIAAQATPRIVSGDGAYASQLQRKPARIIYSGDGNAVLAGPTGRPYQTHLTWTSWNSKEGRAWGADWHNNCNPYCAAGTFSAYRANVQVYRPEHVAGYLLFTRLTVTYTGSRPPWPAYQHRSLTYKLYATPPSLAPWGVWTFAWM
jgi:hypothetical protein